MPAVRALWFLVALPLALLVSARADSTNRQGDSKEMPAYINSRSVANDAIRHAGSQAELGDLYYSGKGVKPDLKEAVRVYTLAADQGSAEAQNNGI